MYLFLLAGQLHSQKVANFADMLLSDLHPNDTKYTVYLAVHSYAFVVAMGKVYSTLSG